MGNQLDFVYFFYGLAFLLLGSVCLAARQSARRRYHATLLGCFALFHGVDEWLDLTTLLNGDSPLFATARVALMAVSFGFLLEFGRRTAVEDGKPTLGPWVLLVYGAVVAWGSAAGGIAGANVAARYAGAFPGSMAAAWVFAAHARKATDSVPRRLAKLAAAAFVGYAICAGVIVPAAPFWPADIVNQEAFARVVGFPIQLARGALAATLAFLVWGIWKYVQVAELSSERYSATLPRQFANAAGALTLVLALGWWLTESLGQTFELRTEREALGEIDALAGRLRSDTEALDAMALALAGEDVVRRVLAGEHADDRAAAFAALQRDVTATAARTGFLVSRNGTVVVLAGTAKGGVVHDHSAAGYFQQALSGQSGREFVRANSSGEIYYYAASPVRVQATVVGAVVLRKTLDEYAADLARFDHAYFLVDADGLVLLSNRADSLLRPLWTLAEPARRRLAPQIGALVDQAVLPDVIADGTWVSSAGARQYVRRHYTGIGGWSLVLMMPSAGLFAGRVLGILLSLLFTISIMIYLFERERSVRDRVELEKRRALQDLATELQLQALRDPLTGLGNRNKFGDAVAMEIARARRQGTPFSLALYDVDRFKLVNDTHGHQAGDKVLVELSRLVSARIRDVDLLVRWGGEEFLLLCSGCDGPVAMRLAEKLRAAIESANFGAAGPVTCSFGVAQYETGESAEAVIARADAALYRAKIGGRNRVAFGAKAPPPQTAETTAPI